MFVVCTTTIQYINALHTSLPQKKKIFAALMSIKEMITMAVVSRVAVPGCRPAAE